jgi:protein-tyrosine phosphatase
MYERMELEQKHHKVKHERDKAVRKREAMKAKLDEDLNRMKEEVAAENRRMEEKEKEEAFRKARETKERKAQGFWGRLSGKKKKGAWGAEATGSAKEKQVREASAKDAAADEAEQRKEEEHKKLQEGAGTNSKQDDHDSVSSSDSDEDGVSALNAYEKAQFAEAALQLKEQKLVRNRNSKLAYNTIPHSQVRWFATKMAYGLGKREPNVTQVLPWLWIGNAAYAQQLQYLMKLGITHIMNVTADVGNHYPQHFVYQRIPLNDENNVDALSRFPTAVDFIKRVWQCRGKVYVHCSMGVSRAPAVVMAYIIKEKHLSLIDAYRFLKAVRPKVT